jgi:hypothetical protein
MNQTPRRATWNGVPVKLQDLWTLRKREHVATLELWSHLTGWECRIDSDPILMTRVCRSDQEIEDVSAAWKQAMIEKGWV